MGTWNMHPVLRISMAIMGAATVAFGLLWGAIDVGAEPDGVWVECGNAFSLTTGGASLPPECGRALWTVRIQSLFFMWIGFTSVAVAVIATIAGRRRTPESAVHPAT